MEARRRATGASIGMEARAGPGEAQPEHRWRRSRGEPRTSRTSAGVGESDSAASKRAARNAVAEGNGGTTAAGSSRRGDEAPALERARLAGHAHEGPESHAEAEHRQQQPQDAGGAACNAHPAPVLLGKQPADGATLQASQAEGAQRARIGPRNSGTAGGEGLPDCHRPGWRSRLQVGCRRQYTAHRRAGEGDQGVFRPAPNAFRRSARWRRRSAARRRPRARSASAPPSSAEPYAELPATTDHPPDAVWC